MNSEGSKTATIKNRQDRNEQMKGKNQIENVVRVYGAKECDVTKGNLYDNSKVSFMLSERIEQVA